MDLANAEWLLTASALVFAVANGTNDGSTLIGLGMRAPGLPVWGAAVLLMVAVVVTPIVIGTAVAETFLNRLVSFGDQLPEAALVAVISALVIVSILASRGMPTSLTVATLGGLVGSGLGAGLAVQWGSVALVLGIALVTPAVAAFVAFLLSRSAVGLQARGRAQTALRALHGAAFTMQCLAYGANDGQKMLAVFAAVSVERGVAAQVELIHLPILGLFFGLGAFIGLRRYAKTLGLVVLPVRPVNAVVAETSSAAVVLGTALVGSPVSTTQSLVGSLIGSGIHEGFRRVRWRSAVSIVVAWVYTFPLTLLVGALLSWWFGTI